MALIVRRGEQHIAEAGALRLVGDVNRIVPGAGRMIANRKRFLDPVFKGRVDIACTGQGWDVYVAGGDRGPDPREAAIGRVIHQDVNAASALPADVVDDRCVHHAGWIDVWQQIRVVVGGILPGQFDRRRPVSMGSIL